MTKYEGEMGAVGAVGGVGAVGAVGAVGGGGRCEPHGQGVGGAIRTGGEWEGVSRSCSEGLGGGGSSGRGGNNGETPTKPASWRSWVCEHELTRNGTV